MSNQYEVFNPWAEVDPIPVKGINPRLTDLAGKKIGLFRNDKRAALPMANAIETRLKERFPDLQFTSFLRPENLAVVEVNKVKFEEWAKGLDGAIFLVGDSGSCTKYLVYDTISMEELNKPAVVLVNKNFATDAHSAASSKEMPTLRILAETVPCECSVKEKIEAGVDEVIDDAVAALTRPLTELEKSPKPKEVEKVPRKVFAGSFKEVNQFFYKRGWTDGFPIVPPTEEEVAEMLTGTDLPPDHIVGKLIPRMGKVTIEKIAINAVMAGALPTYMPLLIAGVEALLDPHAYFGTFEVSTGSWVPFWIVNGPIRHQVNINSGQGMFSPGDIANAAIGRAMGLIIKNIGGARKGIKDMGIFGNAGKYTMVAAENEEASPWEPLHVQHGFKKEDNTITVAFPFSFTPAAPQGTDADGIMRGLVNAANTRGGWLTVVIQPEHAKTLGDAGWTKQQIATYISDYAYLPANRTSAYRTAWVTGRNRPPLNPDDPVRSISSPEAVRVIVAGGSGALMIYMVAGGRHWTTKKATLPANWDKLVAKYKNLVPTHVRY